MRRITSLCILCCAFPVLFIPFAEAQSSFAPYGAWRGHIRRVDGPFRSVEKIHWGNGVTQVGGQVLMHGFDVAGSVLTNPDFLSKLVKPKSAEDLGDSEARLVIRQIEAKNQTLQTDVSSLLTKLGLAPSPITPVVPFEDGTAPPQDTVESLIKEAREARTKVETAFNNLGPAMASVHALALQIERDKEALRMPPEVQATHSQLLSFLNTVASALKLAPATAPTEPANMDTVSRFAAEITQIVSQVTAYRDVLNQRHQALEKVLKSSFVALGAVGNKQEIETVAQNAMTTVVALTQALDSLPKRTVVPAPVTPAPVTPAPTSNTPAAAPSSPPATPATPANNGAAAGAQPTGTGTSPPKSRKATPPPTSEKATSNPTGTQPEKPAP